MSDVQPWEYEKGRITTDYQRAGLRARGHHDVRVEIAYIPEVESGTQAQQRASLGQHFADQVGDRLD